MSFILFYFFHLFSVPYNILLQYPSRLFVSFSNFSPDCSSQTSNLKSASSRSRARSKRRGSLMESEDKISSTRTQPSTCFSDPRTQKAFEVISHALNCKITFASKRYEHSTISREWRHRLKYNVIFIFFIHYLFLSLCKFFPQKFLSLIYLFHFGNTFKRKWWNKSF